MSKYVSLAALALALVACALIIRERSNREAAIRRALQQREAAMVQRYAPMIQRMIEELDGNGTSIVNIWSVDEGLQALANAVDKLAEERRREQATLHPVRDAAMLERMPVGSGGGDRSLSSPQARYRAAQQAKAAGVGGQSAEQAKLRDRTRVAPAAPTVIAVALNNNGESHIALINAQGNVVQQLTGGPSHDQRPVWSADGAHVAFISDRDDGNELYVMDWQGSDQRRVTNMDEEVRMAAWSPDGKRLAFTTAQGTGIYVIEADGRRPARLLVKNGSMPDWSPDGEQIAYNMGAQIWIADGDGRHPTPLFFDDSAHDHVQALFYPRWSPDGEKILFTSVQSRQPREPEDVQTHVFVTDVASPHRLAIGASDSVDIALDWSPDGRQILFFSDRNSNPGLYVMNANGSGVRRIINADAVFGNWGAWRPSPNTQLASRKKN